MLAGTLAIRDIHDVEAFARRVLTTRLSQWGARLQDDDFQDALAYLIALAWELERGFDENVGMAYSTFLYRLLRLRVADWFRSRFGDSRYGARPSELFDPADELFEQLVDGEDWLGPLIAHASGVPRPQVGSPFTAAQIQAAWTLHTRGRLSIHDLGALLCHRYGYPSAEACAGALQEHFGQLGDDRDDAEAA